MIRCLSLCIVTLFGCHHLIGQEIPWQDKYAGLIEELQIAKSKPDTLNSYYAALLALTDSLAKTEYSRHLIEIKPYYEWLKSHPEITPSNIRRQYMIYGHRLVTYTTFIDEAFQSYLTAHQAGETMDNVEDYFWVENPLGNIYNMKGDHEQSLYFYNYTRKGLERLITDPDLPADRIQYYTSQWERVLNNIAYLHYWNRSYQRALEVIEESYQSAIISQNNTALVFGARYTAEIYTALQQYEEAAAALNRFRALIDLLPAKDQPGNLDLYYQISGILSLQQGDCTSAIQHFKATLQDKNNTNRFIAKNHNRLAQAYLQCNDPESSLYHIREGLIIFGLHLDQLMNQTQKVFEENTLSELLTTAGDYYGYYHERDKAPVYLDSALISFQLSLQTLEMLRDQYLLEGSKVLSIEETRTMIDRIISLQHRLNELAGTKDGLAVWPYMVKSKNVLLSDFDRERKQINNLSDEEQNILKEKYNRIRELTSSLVTDAEGSMDAETELVRLRQEIQLTLKKAKITGGPSKPDKSPFIEYLHTTEGLFSLDNLTGPLRLQKLTAVKGLENLIKGVQADMKKKSTDPGFYERLNALYLILLKPYEPLPAQFTIYPDGTLFLLPFTALINEPHERRYVVQDHVINIGYLHERAARKKSAKSALYAIAPDYPEIDGMLAYERGNLYHLPYAREEVLTLEKNWKGSYTADNLVDKQGFFALLEQEGFLHFAGHALVNASGAWLALSADTASWITYEEISRSMAKVSSVVLSACETGLGNYAPGEGVNSLAKSFLNAGAASVVYSLWAVNDQTTAALMDRYYHHLSAGDPADQALAFAQRDYLDQYTDTRAHPYYWAAFTAADHSSDSTGGYYWLWIIAIIGLTILIYLFYHPKIKKS